MDKNSISPTEVADVLLLVFGGGGEFGIPDPDCDAMSKIIEDWSYQQRQDVIDYADAVYAVASDNTGIKIPPKPQCLIEMMNAMDCQFA